jgi:hypothetical protein
VGQRSSRRIERATYDKVPFRYLAAAQHPKSVDKKSLYSHTPVIDVGGFPPRSLGKST